MAESGAAGRQFGTAVCLALVLTACAPQPTPVDGRHALDMLRRGYSEWVARCAWADGRAGHSLETALRRCQMDLGVRPHAGGGARVIDELPMQEAA
jgi:hypothetical protein